MIKGTAENNNSTNKTALFDTARFAHDKFFYYYIHSAEENKEAHCHICVSCDDKRYPELKPDCKNEKFKTVLKLKLYPKEDMNYNNLSEEATSPYKLSEISEEEKNEIANTMKSLNKKTRKPIMMLLYYYGIVKILI